MQVIRVRIAASALDALGVTVAGPIASGLVDVDLVVSADGWPMEVRRIRPVTTDGPCSECRERRMLMSMSRCVVALAALLIANASAAQPTFTVAVPPPDAVAGRRVVMGPMGGGVPGDQLRPAIAGDLLFVEPLETAEAVSGAPYSADAVTESTQTLADGNRIVRRSSVQLARDGRGRERREHQAMVVGPMVAQRAVALVTITDPAAGTAVTLDHARQVATRMRMRRWASPTVTAMRLPDDAGVAFPPMRGAVAAVGGGAMSWTMTAGDEIGLAVPGVAATPGVSRRP